MKYCLTQRIRGLISILLLLGLFTGCEDDAVENQWSIDPNKASFGVLVFDYTSGDFKAGCFKEFSACETCTGDTIPLDLIYQPPGDFGYIGFKYKTDTLFFGTIIWMGTGEISIPSTMIDAIKFDQNKSVSSDPLSVEYYHDGYLMETPYAGSVGPIWETAQKIDLTAAFSKGDFRIAYYLYPPTMGVFDPLKAKWVLFLYAD